MGEPIQLAPWMCHNCGYWVGEGLTAIPSSCGRCGKSRGPFTHEDNPHPHPTVAAPPVVVPVDAAMDYPAAARVVHSYLHEFCNESLAFPEMIASASRSAGAEILVLRSRLTAVEQERATLRNALCVLLDHLELGEAGVLANDVEWVGKIVESFAGRVIMRGERT